MTEQGSFERDNIVGDCAREISNVWGVSRVVEVKSLDGEPTYLYTLIPEPDGNSHPDAIEKILIPWIEVINRNREALESIGIRVGPVICEGWFNEFIEGSYGMREVHTLYDASAA